MQIVSGGFDYRRAVENAIKSVAASGLSSVQYPSGHSDSLDVAVRRAVLTGVNQTGLKMQDARMDEMDCQFVEVSATGEPEIRVQVRPTMRAGRGKSIAEKESQKSIRIFTALPGTALAKGWAAGIAGIITMRFIRGSPNGCIRIRT